MKKRTLKIIAAVSVAGAIGATTLGVLSDGFRNWNTSTWFGSKTEQTQTPTKTDEKDKLDVNGMIVEAQNTEYMSLRMVARASGAENNTADGVVITATVLPEEASDKTVEYTIAWKNPASAWANGKAVEDYVDMTVSGATATVSAKEAFGEQIIVTCKSVDNEDISATCTVDYAKRLTKIRFLCSYGSSYVMKDGDYITQETTGKADTILVFGNGYTVGVSPTYGVGTVSDTITLSVKFEASDYYVSNYCSGTVPGAFNFSGGAQTVTFNEAFLQTVFGSSYTSKSAFYSRVKSNGALIGSGVLKATFTASGNYSSMSGAINLGFDINTLGTAVSSVGLDTDNIVL